jgi:hypothetical protein
MLAASTKSPSARTVVDNYVVWCVNITPAEISAAFQIATPWALTAFGNYSAVEVDL